MGGVRSGRALLAMGAGECSRAMTGAANAGKLGCLAALLVTVLALVPASAQAEPLCTDTWTGPGEGSWQTAADWSSGKAPSSTDTACIGTGKTVTIMEGANQVGMIEDKGSLTISGGSLEIRYMHSNDRMEARYGWK